MKLRPEEVNRISAVLQAHTESFSELVRIAGLDPACDFVGADLRGVDFRTDDLSGFDFASADLTGANLSRAGGLYPGMFIGAIYDSTTRWPPKFWPGSHHSQRGGDIRVHVDEDYISGHHFVFQDELGLSEEEKHIIESTTLDFIPENLTFFGTSAGTISTLVAEKMQRPDGSPYVFIRRATPREWFEHMTDEASRPFYEEPYGVHVISEIDAEKALDFLIEIEPNPSSCETLKEYDDLMQLYEPSLTAARRTLRRFAESIEPKTLSSMRKVYYRMLSVYAENSFDAAVASSYLNEAMHGVGKWQK